MDEKGRKGVCFDVWAPNASRVYVIGDFNGWNEYSHEMQRVEPTTMGVYELFVPEAGLGTQYKYLIIAKDTQCSALQRDLIQEWIPETLPSHCL